MTRTLLGLLATLFLTASPVHAVVILVDDDEVQCPAALFNTIQAAINAANNGDTVRVCAGVYDEQILIDGTKASPLTIKGDNGAIIKPSPMVANAASLVTSAPIAAVVFISETTAIIVQSVTVDAGDNGFTGCGTNVVGVLVQNADAKVQNAAVRNTKLGPGLEGCQAGLGIFVQSGNAGTSDVTVSSTSVHDYQKNGITANEPGSSLTAKSNKVTGWGPTDDIAQNGIQIGFGATGVIDGNTIANHIWTPCVSPDNCAFASTNILVFDAPSTKILKNNTTKSQVNIYVQANGATITGNTVTDTDVFDGLAMVGNNNLAQTNTITNSDESGIFVDGTGNTATKNVINESPIGVWNFSGGTGNTVAPNKYYNVLKKNQSGAAPVPVSTRQLSVVR